MLSKQVPGSKIYYAQVIIFELKNRTRYRSRFGRKFQEILKENERDKNSFIPKDDHKDVAGQLMEKILTDAVKQVSVTIRQ